MPKKQGGLGVGDLMIKNAALLFKWWWRYACEEGAIWRRVVQSLYEEDQNLLPIKKTTSLAGPWRDIKQIAWKESPTSRAFFENISVRVGKGSRVNFWLDKWAHKLTLRELFPMLFTLSSQQQEKISNMGWFEGQLWRWTLTWKRQPSPVEQQQIIELQVFLQQMQPTRDANDQLL